MSSKFISIFLLALLLVSPFAFAAELKLVKVSELKEGDVIVDKDGNEIKVEIIKTKETKFLSIGQVIADIFGSNSNYNKNLPRQYVASSGEDKGISLVPISGRVTADLDLIDSLATEADAYFTLNPERRNSALPSLGPAEPISRMLGRTNAKDIFGVDDKGNILLPAFPSDVSDNYQFIVDRESNIILQDLDNDLEYKLKDDETWELLNIGTGIATEDMYSTSTKLNSDQLVAVFGKDFVQEQNKDYYKAPSGAIYSVKTGSNFNPNNLDSAKYEGRGEIQTTFGAQGFAMGHIIEGLTWATTAFTLISAFGGVLGEDTENTDALSVAVGAGILAGKLTYSLLGKGGAYGFVEKSSLLPNWLSNPWFSTAIGAGVAWITYNSMWEKKDIKNETVNFQCLPWQAPNGGSACELCNDDTLPCSEYRCKSLGQSCGIINKGTTAERCVNLNPRDTNPPVLKPSTANLSFGLYYEENPSGAGFQIKSKQTTSGCIPPYTEVEFAITANEPAQCKIDYEQGKNYSQMKTFLGGSNLYSYNHSDRLILPSSDDFANSSLTLQNGRILDLYVKCTDASGNTNEADYEIELCVDPSPDLTAPQIRATSIPSSSCVASDTENSTVNFYVNEPAECKWSFQDQSFDSMQYNMSCATQITEINAMQLYTCTTTLNGISKQGTDFYVKCRDQPALKGINESKRNTNADSFKYTLRGSNPLKMQNLKPNETIFGAIRPAPVELSVQTLFGCDQNKATCFYSTTGNDLDYVQFFDTGKEDGIHTQRLDLFDGTYNYFVKCVDSGGNLAQNSTTFKLEIDTNAPIITRIYQEDDFLKISTQRNSDCVFTNTNCDYLFDEGTVMPYANSQVHVTPWLQDRTYYIKCKDEFRSEPTSCSAIVRPTDNFL